MKNIIQRPRKANKEKKFGPVPVDLFLNRNGCQQASFDLVDPEKIRILMSPIFNERDIAGIVGVQPEMMFCNKTPVLQEVGDKNSQVLFPAGGSNGNHPVICIR